MDSLTAAILLLLVIASGLFSGAEAALFSLNRVQVRQVEGRHDPASRAVCRLMRTPQRLLNSLVVGNTLVNIGLSAVVTSLALSRLGEDGVKFAILIATALTVIVCEILPKTIAVNFPRTISRFAALPLLFLERMMRPLNWAVTGVSAGVLRLVRHPAPKGRADRRMTPSELRAVFEEVDEGVGMSKIESRLVQNILAFSQTTAEEVMTPRVDIAAAPTSAGPEELRALILSTKHSRIPLYEKTLDSIVAFLPARAFLLDPKASIEKLKRPVLVVPEKAPADRIFLDLRKERWRMAIVVNEYGETVGLLTQEDLIEEIVGELSDEYEQVEEEIAPIGDGVFEVLGRASLQDLGSALSVDLPQEQAVTVNGFLCSLYGGFPRAGTSIRYGSLKFEVLEVARHRIQRARVRRTIAEDES